MSTTLPDTTAAAVNRALINARRALGGPTAGHVLTLVVAADGHDHSATVQATAQAPDIAFEKVFGLVLGRNGNAADLGRFASSRFLVQFGT